LIFSHAFPEKILADMQPLGNARRPHGVGGCDSAEASQGRLANAAMRKTTQSRRKARRKLKTTARRPKRTTARNIEIYGSAYRTALKHISALQKRDQPDLSLRLHASIRRQLNEGAKDPNLIASKAVSDLQTYTGVSHKRPSNGRRNRH
jgi:hypothetical protein